MSNVKNMDIQDLKNKSISDLHKLLAETRDKLRELRFKASEGQLKTNHQVKAVRKDIARILTLINEQKQA